MSLYVFLYVLACVQPAVFVWIGQYFEECDFWDDKACDQFVNFAVCFLSLISLLSSPSLFSLSLSLSLYLLAHTHGSRISHRFIVSDILVSPHHTLPSPPPLRAIRLVGRYANRDANRDACE
jgi:hypothetical protein